MRFIRSIYFLFVFYCFATGIAFAQTPKIFKLIDLKPGTKAIGFSVFRGVEPEPFDVVLGETMERVGSRFILAGISGGPMETPLEKVGAVSGMSGSPIFVDCLDLDDCVENGTLVGALSYSIGSFIEGGMNVLLTPAEYMLGARVSGYVAASQFSNRMPNRINIGGREFKNLMLFSGIDSFSAQTGPTNSCNSSSKIVLRPGSMVTVFLARGDMPIGGSGTVTWVDGDKIYIFGHEFFGTGIVNYPFVHVGVATTIQTPFQAYKIAGCSLETRGAMLVDGAFEMAGVIGRVAPTIPLRVELHLKDGLAILSEEVASSPMAKSIFSNIPSVWAKQLFGDMNSLSLAYQVRIVIQNEPEIFLKNIIPVGIVVNVNGVPEDPFSELFSRIGTVFKNLEKSGFSYGVEGIQVRVDFINDLKIWKKKTAFLSQEKALPGETIYVNVVLGQSSDGSIKEISIPVKIPEDFITKRDSLNIGVMVQSSLRFTDKRPSVQSASIGDVIVKLKQDMNLPSNVLYVQQILPRTKIDIETDKANAKSLTKKSLDWIDIGAGELQQLPPRENMEVKLSITPPLDNFIDFEATFNITVQAKEEKTTPVSNNKNKNKRWFFIFLR